MSGLSDDLVGAVVAAGGFVIHLAAVLRAITRPDRTPASRVAWIAAIMCLPVIGVIAYFFLGETSIGRERSRRLRDAESRLAKPSGSDAAAKLDGPAAASVSELCRSINGFGPTAGNRLSAAALAPVVADVNLYLPCLVVAACCAVIAFFAIRRPQRGLL